MMLLVVTIGRKWVWIHCEDVPSLEEFQVIFKLTLARSAAKCLLSHAYHDLGILLVNFIGKRFMACIIRASLVAVEPFNIFLVSFTVFVVGNLVVLVLFNIQILMMLLRQNIIWMVGFSLVGNWQLCLQRRIGRSQLIWGLGSEGGRNHLLFVLLAICNIQLYSAENTQVPLNTF